MKALIFDDSCENDLTGERVLSSLKSEMHSRNLEVEHILLHQRKIGNCAGDFFCWIRNPGQCNIDDDNRCIAQSVTGRELLVFLAPVTFGGYSSLLKRMVDHLTQNNLPFFTSRSGEIHHPHRNAHVPKLLAIGWTDKPEPEETATFHQLGWRANSIRTSLELTAGSLASSNPVPDEAVGLMAKQRISKWMILLLGPIVWLWKARKYGAAHALWRRPYLSN